MFLLIFSLNNYIYQKGKSTYRTEILFKKFRWRPNYNNKNSKAYRDLINGIKVTVSDKIVLKNIKFSLLLNLGYQTLTDFFSYCLKFKELFTRKSGKKKGGFRKVKVKGIR